jgi:hypothetical protein
LTVTYNVDSVDLDVDIRSPVSAPLADGRFRPEVNGQGQGWGQTSTYRFAAVKLNAGVKVDVNVHVIVNVRRCRRRAPRGTTTSAQLVINHHTATSTSTTVVNVKVDVDPATRRGLQDRRDRQERIVHAGRPGAGRRRSASPGALQDRRHAGVDADPGIRDRGNRRRERILHARVARRLARRAR